MCVKYELSGKASSNTRQPRSEWFRPGSQRKFPLKNEKNKKERGTETRGARTQNPALQILLLHMRLYNVAEIHSPRNDFAKRIALLAQVPTQTLCRCPRRASCYVVKKKKRNASSRLFFPLTDEVWSPGKNTPDKRRKEKL